ncbi:unknown protein [Seminavis robusta]|uniref:Fungal lipase-type domain-containing protein n=1 Tax=Seminavis robusta TaxID=568900 RepID=A0A9N8H5Y3_9STRA|nr:unknown protein [Seminavis robusta]|eukprot:Sro33_g021280.1 n/a (356) ;mRNA; f:40697-41764
MTKQPVGIWLVSTVITLLCVNFARGNDHLGGQHFTEERGETCPSLPSVSVTFEISASRLEDVYQSAKLITLSAVQSIDKLVEENQDNYDLFQGWADWDDRTILAKLNGTCYVAFGFPEGTLLDPIQNLNPLTQPVGDCLVRRGFFDAYNTSSYAQEFRQELNTCLASCSSNGQRQQCPLVTTGYSQGGAVAVVATIDLRRHAPTFITFGATKAILDDASCRNPVEQHPCTDFRVDQHYQFVNVLEGDYEDLIHFQPLMWDDSCFWMKTRTLSLDLLAPSMGKMSTLRPPEVHGPTRFMMPISIDRELNDSTVNKTVPHCQLPGGSPIMSATTMMNATVDCVKRIPMFLLKHDDAS